jgi:hypothetical protein
MPVEKDYTKDIYDYLGTLDNTYQKDVPLEKFRTSMKDKKYAADIHSWIGSVDETFVKDVPFENFYTSINTSKKKVSSIPNLSDIGQPFTSGVQTPLVKPSPLVSNSSSVSETRPTTTNKFPSIQTLPSENTSVNTVNTYDTNLAREERKQKLGTYTTDLMDYIGKNSQDFVKKGGISPRGIEPEGLPNVDNIRNLVESYAEKQLKNNKIELSSFDKQYLINNLSEQVKNKKTVQDAAINTNLKLRDKYGYDLTAFTGVKDQKGNVITKGLFDKTAEQINNEQSKILQSYKEKVSTLNTKVSTEIKPILANLNNEAKLEGEKLNQEFMGAIQMDAEPKLKELNNYYTQLVQNGQITAEQANAEYKTQAEQIYKDSQNVISPQFDVKFQELNKIANDKSKAIQGEYNRKYLAQVEREKQNADLKLKEAVAKYGNNIPKEFLADYEAISKKELEKSFKINAEKSYQAARNTDLTTRLDKALKAGFGDVLGSVGGAISYLTAESSGVNDAVINVAMQNELPNGYFADKSLGEKLSDSQWWIDNGVRSVPFMLATMPVGIAAGTGASAFARLLNASKRGQMLAGATGGGTVSWFGENLLETGSAFKEAIDSGMSEKDASAIAANTFRNNLATLPLNVVQMMPIFSKSFKFIQSSVVEGVSGGLEEIIQGWSQAQAKAKSMGQDISLYEYFLTDQAKEEGIIGATMSQGMAMLSLNNTQDIDKQIATIMNSIAVGGEQNARVALDIMNKNGVLSDTEFAEANSLIDYTMKGIEQVQGIKVDDNLKAILISKYAKIGRAKALMSDDENDLASQAAKEMIAEQEKEIKEILKGNTPIYLVFRKGQDMPISTTKEELISILKDKNLREEFRVQAINDDRWQAQIDKVYGIESENKPIEEIENGLIEQNGENKAENLPLNEQIVENELEVQLNSLPKEVFAEIDLALHKEGVTELVKEGKIEYVDDVTKQSCLRYGGRGNSFNRGSQWEIVKDLKGYKPHEKGGVDLSIGKNGVEVINGKSKFYAKNGLLFSDGDPIEKRIAPTYSDKEAASIKEHEKFLSDFIQSPKYKEMLLKQYGGDEKAANDNIKKRLEQLELTKYSNTLLNEKTGEYEKDIFRFSIAKNFNPELAHTAITEEDKKRINADVYLPSDAFTSSFDTSEEIGKDPTNFHRYPKNANVPAHEMTHRTLGGNAENLITPYAKEKIKNIMAGTRPFEKNMGNKKGVNPDSDPTGIGAKNEKNENYWQKPTEVLARLNSFRKLLSDNKVYDPNTESIDSEKYNLFKDKINNRYKELSNKNYNKLTVEEKAELQNIYDIESSFRYINDNTDNKTPINTDKIIWMLNNLVKNETKGGDYNV